MEFWPQDGTTIIGSLHIIADLTVVDEEMLTNQASNLLRERVPCLKQLTVQVEDVLLQDCSCRGESTAFAGATALIHNDVAAGSATLAAAAMRRAAAGHKEKD